MLIIYHLSYKDVHSTFPFQGVYSLGAITYPNTYNTNCIKCLVFVEFLSSFILFLSLGDDAALKKKKKHLSSQFTEGYYVEIKFIATTYSKLNYY